MSTAGELSRAQLSLARAGHQERASGVAPAVFGWDLEESACRAPPPGLCRSTQGILKVAKTKFFSKVLQDLPWFEKGCVKSSP